MVALLLKGVIAVPGMCKEIEFIIILKHRARVLIDLKRETIRRM
jgi:hypothetical protein